MRFFFSTTLLLVLIVAAALSICAQSEKDKGKRDFTVWTGLVSASDGASNVTYAKKGDKNPNKIRVKGIIVDAAFPQTYCGNTAHAGTFKLKPDEKIPNYEDKFVYVVVLCPAGNKEGDLIDKPVEISAIKLTEYPYSFQVVLSNKFHTKKTPYYVLDVEGSGDLLKKLQIH